MGRYILNENAMVVRGGGGDGCWGKKVMNEGTGGKMKKGKEKKEEITSKRD